MLVTREARLGLNGPQVIEQEAGIAEYDAKDRPFIWSLTGGEQRHASGLVDGYVADDIEALRERLLQLLDAPAKDRASQHAWFLERLARLGEDCLQLDAAAVRILYQGEAK
ncbi:Malonyl-S-ACP:biotin-protein carboxyltransferase MADC [compost metagenome]